MEKKIDWDKRLNKILNDSIFRITDDTSFGELSNKVISNVVSMRNKMKNFNLQERNCGLSKILAFLKMDLNT